MNINLCPILSKKLTSSRFEKHRLFKNVMLQPPNSPKMVFLKLSFFEDKTLLLWKHNLRYKKTKIRRRDLKNKTRQEAQKQQGFMKEPFKYNNLSLFFSRKKKQRNEARKKQKAKSKEGKQKKKTRKEEINKRRIERE